MPIAPAKPKFLVSKDLVATIVDLILSAWATAITKKKIKNDQDEPTIAGILGDFMKKEKNRRNLKEQIRIEEEAGVRAHGSTKTSGWIDIKIIYSFDENEYFGIECKRVNSVGRKLALKYVEDGVMRFVDGRYALGHSLGLMLGFIVDNQKKRTIGAVKREISNHRIELHTTMNWRRERGYGGYPNLYRTGHEQYPSKSTIILIHCFVMTP
jgi:hypothetical protein